MREPSAPAEPDTVIGTVKNESDGGESSNAIGSDHGTLSLVEGGRWAKLSARAIADRHLSATVLRVLAAIGTYANREGIAWPSQDTIATVVGINRATVCRAIKRLRERGYLDRYRKPTTRGRYRNVYQLRYPPYVPFRPRIVSPET